MSNVVSLTVETPQPLLEPCPGAFLARHSVDRNFFRELAQMYPSIWPLLESIRIAPRGVSARDLDPPPAFYPSDLITFVRSRNHTTVVGIEEDVPCRLKEVVVADTTAPSSAFVALKLCDEYKDNFIRIQPLMSIELLLWVRQCLQSQRFWA